MQYAVCAIPRGYTHPEHAHRPVYNCLQLSGNSGDSKHHHHHPLSRPLAPTESAATATTTTQVSCPSPSPYSKHGICHRRVFVPPPRQDVDVDIENVHGSVAEWIAQPGVARKVRRVFCAFLLSYVDEDNNHIYKQRIQDMVSGAVRSAGCDP
eukprot:358290-Chlamydomonas_euryale.AAC.3